MPCRQRGRGSRQGQSNCLDSLTSDSSKSSPCWLFWCILRTPFLLRHAIAESVMEVVLWHPYQDQQNKHSSAKAVKKLTKAELLFNKVRSNLDMYPTLFCIDDELLLEWAKLRTKKGASDSGRALRRIEETLNELKCSHGIHPGFAISKQCDAGWTTVEVDYFVKGNQQQPIQQDDTSWGNNMQAAYIPNQQKAISHE